jgi:hypothetical protein
VLVLEVSLDPHELPAPARAVVLDPLGLLLQLGASTRVSSATLTYPNARTAEPFHEPAVAGAAGGSVRFSISSSSAQNGPDLFGSAIR